MNRGNALVIALFESCRPDSIRQLSQSKPQGVSLVPIKGTPCLFSMGASPVCACGFESPSPELIVGSAVLRAEGADFPWR